MAAFDFSPDPRMTLKIAETREELEACFHLLHDAYVEFGYMHPQRSGMRVTAYHALPTTTTLCAMYDGEVVGTISLIRDGVFGFPVQQAFDLHGLRQQSGHIAEASALAVKPAFRKHGGMTVFPLMKFMYEYCTKYFDTRHLVIAVNPKHINFYESVLMVQRLQEKWSTTMTSSTAPLRSAARSICTTPPASCARPTRTSRAIAAWRLISWIWTCPISSGPRVVTTSRTTRS